MTLISRLKRTPQAIASCLANVIPVQPLPVWLWFFWPLVLAWALICAVGPELQAHTLPLSTSIAPSIYESVYPDTLARFLSLSDWLAMAFTPMPMSIAIVVTLSAFRARTVHGFALASGAALAVAYSLWDVAIVAFTSATTDSLIGSFVANIAGGALAIAVAYLTVSLVAFITDQLADRRRTALVVVAVSLIALGCTLSVATRWAITTFFRPLRANIELTAALPLNGEFGPPRARSPEVEGRNSREINALRLMSENASATSIDFASPREAGTLDWRREATSPTYDVDVYFFSGCVETAQQAIGPNPDLTFEGVQSIRLENGPSDLTVSGEGRFSVAPDLQGIVSASLPKATTEGTYDLNLMVGSGEAFGLSDAGSSRITAVTRLFATPASPLKLQAKTLSFWINGSQHQLVVRPDPNIRPDELMRCTRLRLGQSQRSQLSRAQIAEVGTDQITAGFVLDVREVGRPPGVFATAPVKLNIEPNTGWVTIHDLVSRDASYWGKLGTANFSGQVSNMTVYGQDLSPGPDTLFIVGRFELFRVAQDAVRISGSADAVFKNGIRLNRTRWELLSEGFKLFLFATLSTVLGALIAFCRRTLKGRCNEDPKTWF